MGAPGALRALVGRPSGSGAGLYWLLDQSALPQRGWVARRLGKADWLDLLSGESETGFNGASPLLVRANGRGDDADLRLADELHRVGRYANAISLIATRRSLADLQAQMRRRARIKLSGQLEAVLRYFDTRTLPLLPRLFTPAQYAIFTSDLDRWWYLDRRGELQEMPPAVGGAATQPSSGQAELLELDDAQEAMLIDDGLTDAVIDFLLTQGHPALGDRTPPDQYELIDPLVTAARSAGLGEYVDVIAFVDRALADGPQ